MIRRISWAILAVNIAIFSPGSLAATIVVSSPLITTADDDDAVFLVGNEGNDYIENQSLVRTEGVSADALRFRGIGGSIVNNETAVIETQGDAFSVGIRAAGDEVSIQNDGTIETTGINGDGIVIFGNGNAEGLLIPRDPGEFVGNAVLNNGDITVSGRGADSFVMEGSGTTFTNTGTVTNNALLRLFDETGAPRYDNGTGVYLAGLDNHLINDGGTISTTGANSTTVRLGPDNSLYNSGIIENTGGIDATSDGSVSDGSAVFGQGDNIVIANDGTIRGDINLQYGSQRLELGANGTIEGTTSVAQFDDLLFPAARDSLQVDSGLASKPLDGSSFIGFDDFEKIGMGDLELSGDLDLSTTGTGVVEEGALVLTGDSIKLDRLTINSGAALEGIGDVEGDVTVQAGGTLAPGFSPGTLTIHGDLFVDGVLNLEVGGLGEGQFDLIDVLGTADLADALIRFIFIDDFIPEIGDEFSFLSAAGDLIGLSTSTFAYSGLGEGFEFDVLQTNGVLSFEALTDGVAAVSTPGSTALLIIGLASLSFRRRQRRLNF